MTRLVIASLCAVVVVYAAVQLVLVRHESRQIFVELQDLDAVRSDLELEWGQLLLEEATWGTHGRVEQIAREQLQMQNPTPEKVFGVEL